MREQHMCMYGLVSKQLPAIVTLRLPMEHDDVCDLYAIALEKYTIKYISFCSLIRLFRQRRHNKIIDGRIVHPLFH